MIVEHMKGTDSRYLLIIDEVDKLRKRPGEEPVDNLVYSLSRINERAERIAVAIYLLQTTPVLLKDFLPHHFHHWP